MATGRRLRWASFPGKLAVAAMAVAMAVAGAGCSVASKPPAAPPAVGRQAAPRLGVAAQTIAQREASAAAAALQRWYNGRSYSDAHWWQSAIALSAVISYMQASGSRAYTGDLAATYRAFHNTGDFTRNYYDDMGWWALAWAQAYALTGQAAYLAESTHIFAAMAASWDTTCGGGIPWSKLHYYKNSITNELFLDAAATLHNLIPGDRRYARWAQREWRWFSGTGLITRRHLVLDGLTSACAPARPSVTWTYNQGVLIGALLQLNEFSPNGRPLALARKVAAAVMNSRTLSPGGILTEPCQRAGCGTDANIFKGVLAQNLGALSAAAPSRALTGYLRRNAASVWVNDRSGDTFGVSWAGPFDAAGTAPQAAALAILTARITAVGA